MDTLWELNRKLEDILGKNITDVPYEGLEVNREGIMEDIKELISQIPYSLIEKIKQNQ